MIQSLSISNYALIERANVTFNGGFTAITGESGAGKSILLEALSLLLGSRANFQAIRKGEEKCAVEGVFTMTASVQAYLGEQGLDVLSEVILRRELTTQGRSRAFVNDTPVSVQVLKDVGRMLVDLHGQQENMALQSSAFQVRQLDLFAGTVPDFEAYARAFKEWKTAERHLQELKEQEAQQRRDRDYVQFQFEEMQHLSFDEQSFTDLEDEMSQLEHAEEILRGLHSVALALDNDRDGSGAISAVQAAQHSAQSMTNLAPSLGELANRLRSALIEIEDISSEVAQMQNRVEVNPTRLELLQERMDEYQRLFHKHGVSDISGLREVFETFSSRLQTMDTFDEALQQAEAHVRESLHECIRLARILSKKRAAALPDFERSLLGYVHTLGMPKAKFTMPLQPLEVPGASGMETARMLFDANGSEPLSPMENVASGGEVARLMLALKSIQHTPDEAGEQCLLFDEIDTGVSGEVARRIGGLMKVLGQKSQVIAVTHLPGVAAKGDYHIRISKHSLEDKVFSSLHYLNKEARVEELAGMFSGDAVDEASLQSARNLLDGE